MKTQIFSAILVLALGSMACGFSFNIPNQVEAGPDVKESIAVTDPKSDETRVSLEFSAGNLKLSMGAKNLVDGTIVYNVDDLKPKVIENDAEIKIKQGDFAGIPPFDGMKNEWDLKLGNAPMDLAIQAGAYSGEYELGGLALKSLTISDGAADVNLSFSEPNLVEMSELRYSTGASDVRLEGLANANFSTLVFDGGAGNYTLDFSGELQRDATVSIDSGLSDLRIVIPKNVNTIITIDGGLTDISAGAGWSQRGSVYTQAGEGPTLTIVINMGAGNLTITD